MTVSNLSIDSGDVSYYDPAFRRMIEDHLQILRTDPNVAVVGVDPIQIYKYNGNFYQLLMDAGQKDYYMHWIIMRVTGLKSPDEPLDDLKQIILPSLTTIRQLMSVFKQTNTKIN
jgi:hypothetical protein